MAQWPGTLSTSPHTRSVPPSLSKPANLAFPGCPALPSPPTGRAFPSLPTDKPSSHLHLFAQVKGLDQVASLVACLLRLIVLFLGLQCRGTTSGRSHNAAATGMCG